MSDSRTQFFRHETHAALKENRFLLPLVPLVTLVALCAYHEWIPIRFDGEAAFLANLLKTVWPAIAWIPPCLMLKRPDLRNPDAAWRTLPVSKEVVFGSRLLVVGVFTVAIPALMVGLAALCGNDGDARSQFTLMAAYQWAYLWIGALAAYALRGYRGLALITGMAVAVVLAGVTFWCIKSFDTQFTKSRATREHQEAFGLLLPWLVVAVGGPLAAALHIRKPDAKPRPWLWIAGAFLAAPAVVMLQWLIGDSGRSIMLPSHKLPTVEADLAYYPAASGFNGIASNAAIPLPSGFTAFRTEEPMAYEWGFASGDWKSRSGNGFIGKNDSAKLRFTIAPKSTEVSVMPPHSARDHYRRCAFGHWISFGPALGLSHPTILETKPGSSAQWHPIPTEPRRFGLTINFFEPTKYGKEWSKVKPGDTVSINAGIPVHEALPPKMILRTKLNALHNGGKVNREMPKGFALTDLRGEHGGVGGAPSVRLTYDKHQTLGVVGGVFGKDYTKHPVYGVHIIGLLLNRRLEQAVFLDGNSWTFDSPWFPTENTGMNLQLPDKSTGGILPKSWLDEAELIVLESENGPAMTLPLKLSFKVPDNLAK